MICETASAPGKGTWNFVADGSGWRRRAGDGTVPYASLRHAATWGAWDQEKQVHVVELPGAKHREMLVDPRLHRVLDGWLCPQLTLTVLGARSRDGECAMLLGDAVAVEPKGPRGAAAQEILLNETCVLGPVRCWACHRGVVRWVAVRRRESLRSGVVPLGPAPPPAARASRPSHSSHPSCRTLPPSTAGRPT